MMVMMTAAVRPTMQVSLCLTMACALLALSSICCLQAWIRLSLNLEHLGEYDACLEAVRSASEDGHVRGGDLVEIRQRLASKYRLYGGNRLLLLLLYCCTQRAMIYVSGILCFSERSEFYFLHEVQFCSEDERVIG